MIKATGRTGDGRPLALLGLSGENLTRLVAGEPIIVELAQMRLPDLQVVIVYGKTESAILDELNKEGGLEKLLNSQGGSRQPSRLESRQPGAVPD